MQRFAVLIALVLAVGASPIARPAHAELTDTEAVCQLRSHFIMTSFTRKYALCLLKCAHSATSPAVAAQTCPQTAACQDSSGKTCRCLERAVDQAITTQIRTDRCPDCPECYVNTNGTGTNPECESDANAKVSAGSAWAEGLFFSGSPALFCDDTASPDGQLGQEDRCQTTTAKTIAFFARTKALCIRSCRDDLHDGSTPAGSCDSPIATNPSAQQRAKDCIRRAEGKALDRIEKACPPGQPNVPECWGSADAQHWVDLAETFVDGQDSAFYCVDQ